MGMRESIANRNRLLRSVIRSEGIALIWLAALVSGLSATELQAVNSAQIPFSLAGLPLPVWSGGVLLTVENAHSGLPVVRGSDINGRDVLRFPLTIPGASHVQTYSFRFGRGLDGSLAVAGSAFSDDSRGATFIARAHPDTGEQIVTTVSPFFVYALTIASDSTIWAAGREAAKDGKEVPDHAIIRRYDKTGKALDPLLPRSSLKTSGRFLHPAEYSYLFSSKDRVGWYSEAMSTYIEYAPDGTELGRFSTVPTQTGIRVLGFALCDDGRPFTSAEILDKSGRVTSWRIFGLNRQTHQWQVVHEKGAWGALYGCDGQRLVTSVDGQTLTWLEVSSTLPAK